MTRAQPTSAGGAAQI